MADMKKAYDDLIIINLYHFTFAHLGDWKLYYNRLDIILKIPTKVCLGNSICN